MQQCIKYDTILYKNYQDLQLFFWWTEYPLLVILLPFTVNKFEFKKKMLAIFISSFLLKIPFRVLAYYWQCTWEYSGQNGYHRKLKKKYDQWSTSGSGQRLWWLCFEEMCKIC